MLRNVITRIKNNLLLKAITKIERLEKELTEEKSSHVDTALAYLEKIGHQEHMVIELSRKLKEAEAKLATRGIEKSPVQVNITTCKYA